jgi:hypothetical protein
LLVGNNFNTFGFPNTNTGVATNEFMSVYLFCIYAFLFFLRLLFFCCC